jgi:hypothetical protein
MVEPDIRHPPMPGKAWRRPDHANRMPAPAGVLFRSGSNREAIAAKGRPIGTIAAQAAPELPGDAPSMCGKSNRKQRIAPAAVPGALEKACREDRFE